MGFPIDFDTQKHYIFTEETAEKPVKEQLNEIREIIKQRGSSSIALTKRIFLVLVNLESRVEELEDKVNRLEHRQ
jgi:hypothetical protein